MSTSLPVLRRGASLRRTDSTGSIASQSTQASGIGPNGELRTTQAKKEAFARITGLVDRAVTLKHSMAVPQKISITTALIRTIEGPSTREGASEDFAIIQSSFGGEHESDCQALLADIKAVKKHSNQFRRAGNFLSEHLFHSAPTLTYTAKEVVKSLRLTLEALQSAEPETSIDLEHGVPATAEEIGMLPSVPQHQLGQIFPGQGTGRDLSRSSAAHTMTASIPCGVPAPQPPVAVRTVEPPRIVALRLNFARAAQASQKAFEDYEKAPIAFQWREFAAVRARAQDAFDKLREALIAEKLPVDIQSN